MTILVTLSDGTIHPVVLCEPDPGDVIQFLANLFWRYSFNTAIRYEDCNISEFEFRKNNYDD